MKTIICIAAMLSLTGCASIQESMQRRPLVDMKGKDVAQYNIDVRECEAYASQIDTQSNVLNRAVGAGVLGAILGAMAGNSGTSAWVGGLAALQGAGSAASESENDKRVIMSRCLTGRGYVTLF